MGVAQGSARIAEYTDCGLKQVSLLVERSGCTATDFENYLIQDTVPPIWDVDPSDFAIQCDSTADPSGAIANWLANDGNGTSSDVCGTATIT